MENFPKNETPEAELPRGNSNEKFPSPSRPRVAAPDPDDAAKLEKVRRSLNVSFPGADKPPEELPITHFDSSLNPEAAPVSQRAHWRHGRFSLKRLFGIALVGLGLTTGESLAEGTQYGPRPEGKTNMTQVVTGKPKAPGFFKNLGKKVWHPTITVSGAPYSPTIENTQYTTGISIAPTARGVKASTGSVESRTVFGGNQGIQYGGSSGTEYKRPGGR